MINKLKVFFVLLLIILVNQNLKVFASNSSSNPFYNEKCPFITYNLKRDDSDKKKDGQVTKLQDFLREQNFFQVASNGYFGPGTADALAKWQKSVGISKQVKKIGTVDEKTKTEINRLCKKGSSSLPKLGKLFITPNGTPTIKVPDSWKVNVVLDRTISSTTPEGEVVTFVTFLDANYPHYRGLKLIIYANHASVDVSEEEYRKSINKVENIIVEKLTNSKGPRHFISKKDVNLYGLSMKEVIHEESDEESTDVPSILKTRIFSGPGLTLALTGVSSKEFTSEADVHLWYNKLFDTIVIPEIKLNSDEKSFLSVKEYSTFVESVKKIIAGMDIVRKIPKGEAHDFFVTSCPMITKELLLGNKDQKGDTQIAKLNKMLFEIYPYKEQVSLDTFTFATVINLIRFQRSMGLEGLGGVGEKTRQIINKHCKLISSSSQAGEVFPPSEIYKGNGFTEIGKNYDAIDSVKVTDNNLTYVAKKGKKFFAVYGEKEFEVNLASDYYAFVNGKIALNYNNPESGTSSMFFNGKFVGTQYQKVMYPIEVGGKLAYTVIKNGKQIIVYDEKEIGENYDSVDMPFNVDGKLVYKAQKNGKTIIVKNGEEINIEYNNPKNVTFVNGKLVYGIYKNEKFSVVYDGKIIGEGYSSVSGIKDVGGKLAYAAYKNGKPLIVYDGKEISGYEKLGPPISVNGKLVFVGYNPQKSKYVIVHDGNEVSSKYEGATYPAEVNGKLAYVANKKGKLIIIYDGKEVDLGKDILVTDSDVYLLSLKGKLVIFIEGSVNNTLLVENN